MTDRTPSYRYHWYPTDGTRDGVSRPFWTIDSLDRAHPRATEAGAKLEVLRDGFWQSSK